MPRIVPTQPVRFLEEYRVRDEQVDEPGDGWRQHMAFGVKVLADFAKKGRIDRAFTEVDAIRLLPAMKKILGDYEQYGKDQLHLRPWTLHRRTTELTIFLDFLHSRKARTLDQIQAADLSEFVSYDSGDRLRLQVIPATGSVLCNPSQRMRVCQHGIELRQSTEVARYYVESTAGTRLGNRRVRILPCTYPLSAHNRSWTKPLRGMR